jgi:hypothetical protein
MVILVAVGAGLIVLGLTLGGGSDDSNDSGATAAGTTGPVAASTGDSTPGTSSGESSDTAKPRSAARGTGGSGTGGSTANADKAAGDDTQSPAEEVKKKSSPKRQGPPQDLADLSPAERKKLHADLYKQGLAICGSFGPEELAKGFNFPTNDPAQLARLYAEAYEARSPSLVLPVQQGCLAGLKQWIAKHG